jgi:hypothetical protein
MKKVVCPLLILSLILYSTPLKADSYSPQPPSIIVEEDEVQCSKETGECDVTPGRVETAEPAPVIESQPADQGTYADQESLVTPSSSDEESSGGTTRLRYIILAVVATIVAVTAMLLVDSNEGHSRHHKHKNK